MKLRSKFNHDFINCGCLHCVILHAYKPRNMQILLQKIQNEIFEILKMSKYSIKFTRAEC